MRTDQFFTIVRSNKVTSSKQRNPILRSYFSNRFFQVLCGSELFNYYPVKDGVAQDTFSGPVLYTSSLFTIPMPSWQHLSMTPRNLPSLSDLEMAFLNMQTYIFQIYKYPLVLFNFHLFPSQIFRQYLEFLLDRRLTMNPHPRLKI